MYTTSLFIAALASIAVAAPSIAVAAPMTESDTNVFFTMISTHSGDPNVHLRSIAANGQRFWLGKDTTTYCPVDNAGVTCSYYNNATTAIGASRNANGTFGMDDGSPGGQQGYVATDGQLGFTQAHSSLVPEGALREPFFYTPQSSPDTVGNFAFNGNGFAACPAADAGVYQIYAQGVPGFVRTDCIGINVATSEYTGAPAWQYL